MSLEDLREITAPARVTVAIEDITKGKRDALMQILKRIKKAQKNMKEIGGFADVELTVLAHLLYKNHNRFRNDKGFKDLKMAKKAALRLYQEVNLPKLMEGFLEDMPVPFDVRTAPKLYLPSTHMVEHALVRLHGSSKLTLRLIGYCQNAGEKARARMKLGHFWNFALYTSACISRLWTLSLSLLREILPLYQALRELYDCHLPTPSTSWLPETYHLPADLLNELTQNDDDGSFTSIAKRLSLDHGRQQPGERLSPPPSEGHSAEDTSVDFGVVVDSSSKGVMVSSVKLHTQQQRAKKRVQKRVEAVTKTVGLLKQFVADESGHRKKDRKTAVTKALSQDQWKQLRKYIKEQADREEADLSEISETILSYIANPSALEVCL